MLEHIIRKLFFLFMVGSLLIPLLQGQANEGGHIHVPAILFPAAAPGTEALTLAPISDAHVTENNPNKNYGRAKDLHMRQTSGTNHHIYLKFDLASQGGNVQAATLRLYAYDGGPSGGAVFATSPDWQENSLTWNNRPAPTGPQLDSVGEVPNDSWVEYDVTAAVSGDGPVAFVLMPQDANSIIFRSDEAGANGPELIIQSDDPAPAPTATTTAPPTATPKATATPGPTATPSGDGSPYPAAPLCPDSGEAHDHHRFHTLWDSERGCHYDHEHGENPFTPAVAAAFPGFDLHALLGHVGIGHTNPSSPMENVHKHGGFKWQVQPETPQGCVTGFEGATYGVDAAVIQYHNFGNYATEFESRIHSSTALVRQCVPGSSDHGYIYTVQHQEYGQRVTPYQGTLIPYPDTPNPQYDGGFGPYVTVDCVGPYLTDCRSSWDFILRHNANANAIWTSKPTGSGQRPDTSTLFRLLFRVRDTFQVLDSSDLVHPFTYVWLCSNDGGASYSARPGCRYNNTTTRVHEVAGTILAEWDNLAGFDTDARVGRITAEGYTDRFGNLDLACSAPSANCFPLKLVEAYVGYWGGELSASKVSNPTPATNPERDIYFCYGVVCGETDAGAVASGWVGPEN